MCLFLCVCVCVRVYVFPWTREEAQSLALKGPSTTPTTSMVRQKERRGRRVQCNVVCKKKCLDKKKRKSGASENEKRVKGLEEKTGRTKGGWGEE